MIIKSDAREIATSISSIKPSRIAVAYVGSGWRKYLPLKYLKEIVVSPTFGSSPKAIREMMEEIGSENVHFLDQLHSKFYIGRSSALVGSFNLSDNGIGGGLLEAALLVQDKKCVRSLNELFDEYVGKAREKYPDKESKRERLLALQRIVDRAQWHGIPTSEGSEPSLVDFVGPADRIHICWYQTFTPSYNMANVAKVIPESVGANLDKFFKSVIMFREDDGIEEGDWILDWRSNNNGYPAKNGAIGWTRVHHVVSKGVKGRGYTKIAAESSKLKAGTPPFHLSDDVKMSIRKILCMDRFEAFREPSRGLWSLSKASELVPDFIDHVRECIE